MKHKLFALCLLLAGTLVARANGDPVAVHSALTLSPTPVAVHVPEVQLVDEYVTFVPDGLYTTVTVRYLLHNRSSKAFEHLPYGFPIDYWGEGKGHWEYIDDIFESKMEKGWRDSYIRNVAFTLGDRQLPWMCSRDTVLVPAKAFYDEAFEDTSYTHEISRRWYYTNLDIPAGSYVTLEVTYQVANTYQEGLYNLSELFVNYREDYFHEMKFQYDFTPASYWGDGHADHFSVWLDTSNINIIREGEPIKGKVSKAISGLPMQERGQWRCYETSRFDLAKAKPFTVDFYPKQRPRQQLDRLLNNRIDPSEYTIEVSGADPKYPVANLSDLNPSTTTVLRRDKRDSLYITIRFKKPTVVEGMLLFNGYTKSAETWHNNSRIASLTVQDSVAFNLSYNDEENRVDTIYFESTTRLLHGERDWIVKWTQFRPMPAKYPMGEPQGYDFQSLVDNAMMLIMQNFMSSNHISEIRIAIADTVKGDKYDDLCVSEIILIKK